MHPGAEPVGAFPVAAGGGENATTAIFSSGLSLKATLEHAGILKLVAGGLAEHIEIIVEFGGIEVTEATFITIEVD